MTRIDEKPARRNSVIFALAVTRSGARTTSSAAPNDIVGPTRQGGRSERRGRRRRGAGGGTCDGYASRRGRVDTRAVGGAPAQPGRLPLSRRRATTSSTSARRSRSAPACGATSTAATARLGIERMVGRISRIEVIVTSTEAEALHLEQNLVKRHRPPFNVRLRDDKSFPYIAVTVADEYPRVMFTRERHRRGTVYFGPYANAKKVRETLDVLNRVFQFRPCEGPKPGRHSGHPVPRLPHRAVHGALHRGDLEGGVPRADRRRDRLPLRRHAVDRRDRSSSGCARRPREERFEDATRYRNRLFAIESLGRAAGRRPAGGRHDRRDRARGGRRPRSGAALPAARRQADRPLRVPPRERRGPGSGDHPRGVLPRVLHGGPERAAAADRPARSDRHRGARGVPLRSFAAAAVEVRAPARGEKRRLAELAAENARARARARGDRGRAEAAAPHRGAREPAREPQPREPAGADRVLRHLEPAGARHRRRRWPCSSTPSRRRRTTARSRCAASTGRTTSRRWRR